MSTSENIEISMCYDNTHELMNRSSTHVNDIFAYFKAHEIIEHDDIEPGIIRLSNKETGLRLSSANFAECKAY